MSSGGGISPLWRADGGELDFQAPDGVVMAAAVERAGAFAARSPVALFAFRPSGSLYSPHCVPSPASTAGGAGNRP